ncbi:MAG: hypothetical protein ABDH66_02410 [Bacteroidia bacterium]
MGMVFWAAAAASGGCRRFRVRQRQRRWRTPPPATSLLPSDST